MATFDRHRDLVIGVDIGGTFTDLVIVDQGTGEIFIGKELTSSDDPSRAVIKGILDLLGRHGLSMDGLGGVVHATTLVTNAIIERKGSHAGLLTTDGFTDVLEIGREAKYDLYDLFLTVPEPLVPRHLRVGAIERVNIDGEIVKPIDLESVDRAVDSLVDGGCEAVAISFLHAYLNSDHEVQAAERIRSRYPDLYLSLSSDVAPEIREYERTNTTAANSYVQPLIDRYLERMLDSLADEGFQGSFFMMLSNGGLTSVAEARSRPIGLLESGPAAGALVAGHYARLTRNDRLMAFDMGGTTAKVCLIDDAEPSTTHLFEAAREQRFKRGSGLPIRTTSVELIEIGAGGGSIARVDDLGLLKVGPESAGAAPGPACYGQGGDAPTVTDANLVLGYYDAASFLGGEMQLNLDAARETIGRLAKDLGVTEAEAAWGIHNVVNEQMASAARIHVAEKGRDARHYSLLATGGAAPCHSARIAQALQMNSVICPPNAGVASAFGLLVAPPRVDLVRSAPMRLDEMDWPKVKRLYQTMEEEASRVLAEAGTEPADVAFTWIADMRYVGQGFEIAVDITGAGEDASPQDVLASRYVNTYRDHFARELPGSPVEALTWRLVATGRRATITDFERTQGVEAQLAAQPEPASQRPAYFPEWGEYRNVPVYDRYSVGTGTRADGPAIIEEREATILVPPGCSWMVDQLGMLIMSWEQSA